MFKSSGPDIEFTNLILGTLGGFGQIISGSGFLASTACLKHPCMPGESINTNKIIVTVLICFMLSPLSLTRNTFNAVIPAGFKPESSAL